MKGAEEEKFQSSKSPVDKPDVKISCRFGVKKKWTKYAKWLVNKMKMKRKKMKSMIYKTED